MGGPVKNSFQPMKQAGAGKAGQGHRIADMDLQETDALGLRP